jgi:hypothetical protein
MNAPVDFEIPIQVTILIVGCGVHTDPYRDSDNREQVT